VIPILFRGGPPAGSFTSFASKGWGEEKKKEKNYVEKGKGGRLSRLTGEPLTVLLARLPSILNGGGGEEKGNQKKKKKKCVS